MSRQELIRMISSDDKAINEVKGPLSVLYRLVLFDLGIKGPVIEQQLDRWVNDPQSGVAQTTKKRTQARGNYIKKMIEPYMTWKSFADLIMMLYPKYIRIELKLGWPGTDAAGNPRETTHVVTMSTAHLLRDDESPSYFSESPNYLGDGPVIENYNPELESEEDTDIYGNSIHGQTYSDFERDDDDED